MRLSARLTLSALALTLSIVTPIATAATIVSQTYSGTFPATITGMLANEDTVLEESFTLSSGGRLTAFTTSYATGGFQPNLTLYSSSGVAVGYQSATPPPRASADPATGIIADGYLNATNLSAGEYTLTLTDWELQQDPTATNLSDGFTFNLGDGTTFSDADGNTRTNVYSLTVDVASSSSTAPEPTSLALVGLALFIAWFSRKHVKSASALCFESAQKGK